LQENLYQHSVAPTVVFLVGFGILGSSDFSSSIVALIHVPHIDPIELEEEKETNAATGAYYAVGLGGFGYA